MEESLRNVHWMCKLENFDQKLKNLVKEIRFYNRFERINLKNQLKTVYTMDIIFKDFNIKIVNRALAEIIPHQYFNNVEKYHGFEPSNAKVWIFHVCRLLKVYQDLSLIILATKTPSYKNAFEAATLNL